MDNINNKKNKNNHHHNHRYHNHHHHHQHQEKKKQNNNNKLLLLLVLLSWPIFLEITPASIESKTKTLETANARFFTGRMSFLSPNQQCQNTTG